MCLMWMTTVFESLGHQIFAADKLLSDDCVSYPIRLGVFVTPRASRMAGQLGIKAGPKK
jgi:hypothetical protein